MAIYGISTRHIKTINRYCIFKGVKARFCDTWVHVHVNTVFTKKRVFFGNLKTVLGISKRRIINLFNSKSNNNFWFYNNKELKKVVTLKNTESEEFKINSEPHIIICCAFKRRTISFKILAIFRLKFVVFKGTWTQF